MNKQLRAALLAAITITGILVPNCIAAPVTEAAAIADLVTQRNTAISERHKVIAQARLGKQAAIRLATIATVLLVTGNVVSTYYPEISGAGNFLAEKISGLLAQQTLLSPVMVAQLYNWSYFAGGALVAYPARSLYNTIRADLTTFNKLDTLDETPTE